MRTHSFADLPGIPKRFDRLFWHTVRMARFSPDIHFATSREVIAPYRISKSIVLHLEPFKTGLVIGWYRDSGLSESEALLRAVSFHEPTQKDLDHFDASKPHGPGPGPRVGLRFSATGSSPMGPGGHRFRVEDPGDAGADGEPDDEFRGRW